MNPRPLSILKKNLHDLCLAFVGQRIHAAREAIRESQSSANEETKSSAGDKYETGRAMAQLEMEKNGVQLVEAQKMKQVLLQINPDLQLTKVQQGSLVVTDQGNFFVSVGAGLLTVEKENYYAISMASPVAQAMLGKSAGDMFIFNKKNYLIKMIL